MSIKDVSRRDFLKYLGIGALGFVARPRLLSALEKGVVPVSFASDVVQCFHEQATSGSTINEPILQMMVDESVMVLSGIRDVGEAWKSLFPGITEASVINIKVNCTNRYLPSHPETVNCIVNGLVQMNIGGASFKKNNVIVWDRLDSEMTNCGFTIYAGNDPGTVRCFGSNHSGVGYDNGVPLNVNGVTSYPSRVLTQMSNYLINLAVLKTHSSANVTLCLKNHFGSVNNASSLQHTSGGSSAIPSLNQQIRDVITPNNIQKLFIVDGLFGLYSGGPTGSPNFNPKLLLMSRDIVACDFQGQNVINAERVNHGLSQLNAAQITNAAQPPYSLGSTDINLIEINNIGVEEGGAPARDSRLEVMPQPLRESARVGFSLARASNVAVDLVDASGRTASPVYSGRLSAGRHEVAWHGRLPGGTYFVRVRSASGTRARKVAVVN